MRWAGSATRLLGMMLGLLLSVGVGTHEGVAAGLTVRVQTDVEPREYVVRPGDTLWAIAASELGDPYRWPEIAAVSAPIVQRRGMRLVNPGLIRPGWTLALPGKPGQGAWDSGTGFSMVRLGVTIRLYFEMVVNNSGQVAGSRAAHGFSDRAFLWDPRTATRDLGALGDEGWSRAQDLNEQGQVVGTASRYVEWYEEVHAFFWDSATGMRDLGTMPPTIRPVTVIDERGHVTGTSMTPEDVAAMAWDSHYPGVIGVFDWDLAAGRRDLGTLDQDPTAGEVVAINEKGQVIHLVQLGSNSFCWDPAAGEQPIGRPGEWTRATAINAAGQVVGALGPSDGDESRAFVWDPETGMTLVGPRGWNEVAISDRGQVAGAGPTGAWRWDPVTGIVDDLGDADEVADINEEGQVVGTSFTTAGHYQAWLWDPVTGRVNLSSPGDHDTTASAINDRGQVAGWAGTIPWEMSEEDNTGEDDLGDAVLWTPIGS